MRLRRNNKETGSVLLVTLVVGAIVGLTLASYLTLVNNQNRSILRSTSWNSAMALAEAGVEESLTHLNINCLSNPIVSRTVNWTADGWTQVGTSPNVFERRRWFGDGWYSVRITNGPTDVNRLANFVVVGGSPVPTAQASAQNGALLAQISTSPNSIQYTMRRLYVQARVQAMFPMGLVAKGVIDMNGNNVNVDSFDSSDPRYSTGGQWDKNKRKDGGSVGTNLGITNSLSVGNANIYGTAATGPGGTISVGSGGGVGSFQYQSTNTGTIQPGWSNDDMNVDFPDVQSPITGGTISPLQNVNYTFTNIFTNSTIVSGITNYVKVTNVISERYDLVFDTGDYILSSGFDGKILVRGQARVQVNHSIDLTGQEVVNIAPGGALALYMNHTSAKFGGNGVVNYGGNATNFSYYGMPANTSIDLKGNAAFTGTIYAPSAELQMGGGGANNLDFAGASITASVKMNGHFNFHYDEALGRTGPLKTYVIETWREIAPPTSTEVSYYTP